MNIIFMPVECILWMVPAAVIGTVGWVNDNKGILKNEPENFIDYSDNIPDREEVYYDISYFEKKLDEQLKAKEKALAQQAQKKNNEVKKIPRKYIQVATLSSEAAAKSAVSKLGGSFSYHKISGKGKTLYVIVSVSTDNQATLSSLENQVKSKLPSSKYIVRTAGK